MSPSLSVIPSESSPEDPSRKLSCPACAGRQRVHQQRPSNHRPADVRPPDVPSPPEWPSLPGRRRFSLPADREAGMATAEYAIATLAAVGFAALLVAVLSSGEIRGLLMSLISSALSFG